MEMQARVFMVAMNTFLALFASKLPLKKSRGKYLGRVKLCLVNVSFLTTDGRHFLDKRKVRQRERRNFTPDKD